MINYIKKNKFNIFVLILYALTTLITIVYHENYRDEAQNWLIAKNLNIIGIFKQMKYEGHPVLWYLILHPFAKLGFPYITENIISWVIMNIAAWILLTKAPFDKYLKILILLTSPFLYWYPVIARSYCLIGLAFVLIAATYKNRKEEPLKYALSIMLLTYTHVVMFGLAGMLYLFFFIEELILNFKKKTPDGKRKILISFFVVVISLIILFLQLFGSVNTNQDVHFEFSIDKNIFKIIKDSLYFDCFLLFGEKYKKVLLIVLGILLIYEFIKNYKNAIIITVSILFQLFVQIYIYPTSEQRVATIILTIILFTWIQIENKQDKQDKKLIFLYIIMSVIFLVNIFTNIKTVYNEFVNVYSPAKEVSTYIKNNIDYKNSVFISSNIPYGTAIVPYINKELYSPQLQNYYSYSVWNEEYERHNDMDIDTVIENINRNFETKENLYFIYCYNWYDEDLDYFISKTNAYELFKSKDNAIREEEKYILYKLYN